MLGDFTMFVKEWRGSESAARMILYFTRDRPC